MLFLIILTSWYTQRGPGEARILTNLKGAEPSSQAYTKGVNRYQQLPRRLTAGGAVPA